MGDKGAAGEPTAGEMGSRGGGVAAEPAEEAEGSRESVGEVLSGGVRNWCWCVGVVDAEIGESLAEEEDGDEESKEEEEEEEAEDDEHDGEEEEDETAAASEASGRGGWTVTGGAAWRSRRERGDDDADEGWDDRDGGRETESNTETEAAAFFSCFNASRWEK